MEQPQSQLQTTDAQAQVQSADAKTQVQTESVEEEDCENKILPQCEKIEDEKDNIIKSDIDNNSKSEGPNLRGIPVFRWSELKATKILGEGTFCHVYAVENVSCSDSEDLSMNLEPENDNDRTKRSQRVARKKRLIKQFQEHHYLKASDKINNLEPFSKDIKPPPRYAVKTIKKALQNQELQQATSDLQVELNILTKVQSHPNIISLYGVGMDQRFLIIDKLFSTLKSRIGKWRGTVHHGVFEYLALDEQGFRNSWLERFLFLRQLASAICFMHRKGIIYRDLKPENIGIDYDDIPKIFDFGLARDLTSIEHDANSSCEYDEKKLLRQSYKLTGMTGSPRYMAPEVALHKNYGLPADIYSFAILICEVLSLKVPFPDVKGVKSLQHLVTVEGKRPYVDPWWPKSISYLLNKMWSGDDQVRPTCDDVEENIEIIMRGSDSNLFPVRGIRRYSNSYSGYTR